MPLPGADKGEMAARNVHNGEAWSALPKDAQMTFSSRIFNALAGIPDLADYDTDVNEEPEQRGDQTVGETAVTKLTEIEEARYRPWYEKLVAVEKVAAAFGKKNNGPSLAKFQLQSKRCIRKIAHQVSSLSVYHTQLLIT